MTPMADFVISGKLRLLVLALGGAAISRLGLPLGSLHWESFYITLLHVAWATLLILGSIAVTRCFTSKEESVWAISIGIVSTLLLPDLYRTGNDADRFPIWISFWPSVILFVAFISPLMITNPLSKARLATETPSRLLAIIPVLSFAMYRASHTIFVWRGIPNQERSLMIEGIEIHHITWATIAICVLVPFLCCMRSRTVFLRCVVLFLLGSIADEFVYMLSIDHLMYSDEYYASLVSTIGGGVTASAASCIVLATRSRTPSTESKS